MVKYGSTTWSTIKIDPISACWIARNFLYFKYVASTPMTKTISHLLLINIELHCFLGEVMPSFSSGEDFYENFSG